jgi:hypothetical protein
VLGIVSAFADGEIPEFSTAVPGHQLALSRNVVYIEKLRD